MGTLTVVQEQPSPQRHREHRITSELVECARLSSVVLASVLPRGCKNEPLCKRFLSTDNRSNQVLSCKVNCFDHICFKPRSKKIEKVLDKICAQVLSKGLFCSVSSVCHNRNQSGEREPEL